MSAIRKFRYVMSVAEAAAVSDQSIEILPIHLAYAYATLSEDDEPGAQALRTYGTNHGWAVSPRQGFLKRTLRPSQVLKHAIQRAAVQAEPSALKVLSDLHERKETNRLLEVVGWSREDFDAWLGMNRGS